MVNRKNKGFTLIETLFAVLILGLTIVGPLSIAAKGLQLALVSKDQTTAFYLAQDAVEYVHFARDTNCLTASAASACTPVQWLVGNGSASATNLAPCTSTDGTAVCFFDSLASDSSAWPTACSGTCPVLYYNPNNKNYTYDVGQTKTIFTRAITIQSLWGGNDCVGTHGCEALLTVKVTWADAGGIQHTVSVVENIFNWE